MKRKLQGKYMRVSTVGENVDAFVPAPLPPNPPIQWNASLRDKFDEALLALGRLDSISTLLPETSLFIYMYVRKEAILSSMIEGTQSSLSDLLLYEIEEEPGVPINDVTEVSNYVAALNHGLKRIEDGFPVSLRLIREIHEVLLSRGRGSDKTPGEFRKSQNWIGGHRPGNAVFVPPPADEVITCMGELELFLHDKPEPAPILLKAALMHLQFETIHPFLDGNGRIGRLLITLLLCEKKVLKEPLLYLSLYFKTHRKVYYELLNRVRETGDWEAWLDFFADAVITTANQAVETAQTLTALAENDRKRIQELGRAAYSALEVHRIMMSHPITTAARIQDEVQMSAATVNRALQNLETLGIINEVTKQKRNRLYSYQQYLSILSAGTERYQG